MCGVQYELVSTQWILVYDARPWSLNQERTKHWSWRASRTEEWVGAFILLAKEAKVPAMTRIGVTVHFQMNGQVQDVCNGYPAAKAAIDGIVQAGVIPDDTPEHLAWVKFVAPTYSKQVRATLIIEAA